MTFAHSIGYSKLRAGAVDNPIEAGEIPTARGMT